MLDETMPKNNTQKDADSLANMSLTSRKNIDDPQTDKNSKNNHRWVIQEKTSTRNRNKSRQEVINFDWILHDGSMLSDEKNSTWMLMAKSYAEVYRLMVPFSCADVFRKRVYALLDFFYWLRMLNAPSLNAVTKDHIDLYSEEIAIGSDYALRSHERLYNYLISTINANDNFPKLAKPKLISRTEALKAAGIWRVDNYGNLSTLCAAIFDWFDTNGLEKAPIIPLQDILNKQKIEFGVTTVQHVQRALAPIEEIWIWRHHLPNNNFTFNPFFSGAGRAANRLGGPTKRHKTIPPRLAISYISDALRWVLDYAPAILEFLNSGNQDYQQLTRSLNELGLDLKIDNNTRTVEYKVTIKKLLNALSAACFVVIATLTARRVQEILDIGAGCITEDIDGQKWLRIYIEKTTQRYDQIPVPNSVSRSIYVLEILSEKARINGPDSLWQVRLDGDIYNLSPELSLNDLAALCRTCEKYGLEWSFTSHQFRRFFAILYFWQYEMGDLAGLSHHLRHLSLEMTKRYVTDTDFGKVLKDIEGEWKADFLRGAIDGSRKIGGKAGNRLKADSSKLLNRFRKSVDVVAPKRTLQYLQRLSMKLGSEFKQHVWGTICACPSNTKFSVHARCRGTSDTGPVFKNANEYLCSDCPFAIHTERFKPSMEDSLHSRENTRRFSESDTMLSEIMDIQIISLQESLAKKDRTPILIESTVVDYE